MGRYGRFHGNAALASIRGPRRKDTVYISQLGKFSLDALVNLTAAAGLTVEIKIKKQCHDRLFVYVT